MADLEAERILMRFHWSLIVIKNDHVDSKHGDDHAEPGHEALHLLENDHCNDKGYEWAHKFKEQGDSWSYSQDALEPERIAESDTDDTRYP